MTSVKNLLKLNKIKRGFLAFEVYGINDELTMEGEENKRIPLKISCAPPSANFIIKTKMMGNFVTQHVDDFGKFVQQIQGAKDNRAKQALLKKMQSEMTNSVVKGFSNPTEIFSRCIELGSEYLVESSEFCYYDENEKLPVIVTATEKDADTLRADPANGNIVVFCVNIFTLDDLALVGQGLLEGRSSNGDVANIPIETEKGGEKFVPADDFANFPLNVGKGLLPNVHTGQDSGEPKVES